ncbi:hypothetical protein bcCo53_001120 (plasmid) [Borrelia coriaceae]|nr:hypothetical protein [Borrelia coriaceae]UPA16952.1 hypothetical protein bcCo53_001120 [Borrelia coriaceae]
MSVKINRSKLLLSLLLSGCSLNKNGYVTYSSGVYASVNLKIKYEIKEKRGEVNLKSEDHRVINYLKDMLMNFEHFMLGMHQKFFKSYTSDEFNSLLAGFAKDGIGSG